MDAFSARFISALAPDRLYRVFVGQGELFFIQYGGQSLGAVVASQFGLLGALVSVPLQKQAQAKLAARLRELELQPPGALLAGGKHNFRATGSEFERSELLGGSSLPLHGPQLGRWVLQLRGRKPMTLQFEAEAEMRRASELLPPAIAVHVNQVAWDPSGGKFTKSS